MATDSQANQTEYPNIKWAEMIRDLVDVDGLYTDVALEQLYQEDVLTEALAQNLTYNVHETAIAQFPNLPSLARGYIEVLPIR